MHDLIAEAEKIPGWMTTEELTWLAGAASEAKTVVEVGCWQGRTSKLLANACAGKLICVDSFIGDGLDEFPIAGDELEKAWREHLAPELAANKVRLIPAPSLIAASQLKAGTVDLVFIDGDHVSPAPLEDLVAWAPKVRKGGMISGHDAGHPGVDEAVGHLKDPERGAGSIWWAKR